MNKKRDIEKIVSTVDFESVSRKLETLAESGELRRRKTVSDLLDKVRPALLRARENRVPFTALAAFLRESGIPVSEPTLRQYINAQSGGKKPARKRPRRASEVASEAARKPAKDAAATKAVKPAAAAAEAPASEGRKLPPRLARRSAL